MKPNRTPYLITLEPSTRYRREARRSLPSRVFAWLTGPCTRAALCVGAVVLTVRIVLRFGWTAYPAVAAVVLLSALAWRAERRR